MQNIHNHLGAIPKVGIRPVIDARLGGIRESLEQTTMAMAERVAHFLSNNLRNYNGSKVECVIADTTIGRVPEAQKCEEKFLREGVGLSITVTTCWCYGTETIDMNPTRPKAIWGFNGTERPGAVYLAAALAGHAQKGVPAFSIYGKEVQDSDDENIPEDVQKLLLQFTKAGLAVAMMNGKSYLSIGSVSMGIAGSIVNESFFQDYLGMRNEYVDMSEVNRRMQLGIFDPEEFEKALKWTKEHCREGKNYNAKELQKSRGRMDEEWETIVKMTLISRDLMIGNPKLAALGFGEEALGHGAIAAGFQGQRQWNDYMPNGDFMEAILNSSFDWNGIRPPYMMATENDSLNGISMLFGYLLTNQAQMFSDVRTYWSPASVERVTGHKLQGKAANGIIHLINSGSSTLDGTGEQEINGKPAMKPFWDISETEAAKCLEATDWPPAMYEYFGGGGYSSHFVTKGEMPVTMCRINVVKGLGPVMQIVEGWTVDLPEEVHHTLDARTNPTWPTTWFAPRLNNDQAFKDVYSVMNNWGANHGAFSYGHFGDELITLCSMLRIPVNMHNIEPERIFRPKDWASFGMDQESADYRACQNYGPLY
ncbi:MULTISPECIES: L-fucose isomerase [unclassified Arenibacter]|uniref:L-fucose isomerase n=1 Tax=unclassified Arenibacter TaxID=2615047 RepID=UPI000E3464A5|nr:MULTISPECIES: L-fucose isomerase [unclassified Arenibacter]MCM4162223.1 L-fucose isomerase [Arenibacter sp. A80]RFT57830.1 L-fucose isomerase [Arenibacter sp. P308M17]